LSNKLVLIFNAKNIKPSWQSTKNFLVLAKQKTQKFLLASFYLIRKIKRFFFPKEQPDDDQQLILNLNKKKIPSWHQFRQLPKFLNRLEKVQLFLALIILLGSACTLAWRFYIKHSVETPAFGGSYIEGMVGAPFYVNPILATSDSDRDLSKLVYAGLMKTDGNGSLQPDLASGYTINANQDQYTFELRSGLQWHDGEAVTAEDIIFTIESIKKAEYKSPYRSTFSGVNVQQLNENTIQFNLEKPNPLFLSSLTIGILPEHLWYSIPAIGAPLTELNIKPIGCGPYMFKSLTKDQSGNVKTYALESFEKYHAGQPYIKDLIFKFYPDFQTAVQALQNKNVEGLAYLPNEYKNSVKNNDLTLKELHNPRYTAVFFNPGNNALLAENNFRQALDLSVDKERIIKEAAENNGQIIFSPVLPGDMGYDSNIKTDLFNQNKATEALDKLGYKKEEGSEWRIITKGKSTSTAELKITTIDQPEMTKAASIIKENWEAIGIKTQLEIIPRERMLKEIIEPRNYQALIFSEQLNINSGPYLFWHSSQVKSPGLNLSNLGNKDIDKYLEQARNASTLEAKIEPLKNFQKKITELNFAIFLYSPTYTYPVANKLKGLDQVQFINLPADRLSTINTWYIKTKRSLKK
jgi:peptide/nickel transport system substrate-binding protein